MDDFYIDDDSAFAKGAGISVISKVYQDIFTQIKVMLDSGIKDAQAGNETAILATANKIIKKAGILLEINSINSKSSEEMSDEEKEKAIQNVITKVSDIDYNSIEIITKAKTDENSNISDNKDHGNLDDI